MSSSQGYYDKFNSARINIKNSVLGADTRCVPLDSRMDKSVIKGEVFESLKAGKNLTEWKGIPMWKDPLSTTIYQTMLWEVKPATIIEIGVYCGGSALWLADHSAMFGINSRVLALDIDLSLLDPKLDRSENVTFIEGDSNKIDEVFPPEMLQELGHPWIIIDDCHENVRGMLEHFSKYMVKGDYFVAEDTHFNTLDVSDADKDAGLDKKDKGDWGLVKMKVLREFSEKYPGEMMVDTRYNDMFGYNGTWNMNGFLRKM